LTLCCEHNRFDETVPQTARRGSAPKLRGSLRVVRQLSDHSAHHFALGPSRLNLSLAKLISHVCSDARYAGRAAYDLSITHAPAKSRVMEMIRSHYIVPL
jgi:hypothetical protein